MAAGLKIISLSNCGVLIATENTTVLIDGICQETAYFDGLDDKRFQQMLKHESPFEAIDYFLFTHCHADHLDQKRLAQYLEDNKVSGIFLPEDHDFVKPELLAAIERCKAEHLSPGFGKKQKGTWQMGDISLTYFFSSHSGKEYQNVNHYALLVEALNTRIYISGDSDFTSDAQIENLRGVEIDFAFYNPFHLHTATGRKIISGVEAKSNLIYHIPPENKDDFNIRRQAMRDIEKYQDLLPHSSLMLDKMISIK